MLIYSNLLTWAFYANTDRVPIQIKESQSCISLQTYLLLHTTLKSTNRFKYWGKILMKTFSRNGKLLFYAQGLRVVRFVIYSKRTESSNERLDFTHGFFICFFLPGQNKSIQMLCYEWYRFHCPTEKQKLKRT